jgi:peptide/nickel transport system substrate-binding protein
VSPRAVIAVAALTVLAACDLRELVLDDVVATDRRHWIGNRDPGSLVIGRAVDAITLDPGLATDNESVEVISQIYDTLVEWEPGTSTIAPGLAIAWSVDETGKEWTFDLAQDVRFHDGTRFDADAVVFALERQRDPEHPYHRDDFQYWPNMFGNIRRIEKVDDDTVRIRIDGPYAPFLANMAMFPVSIVSPTAVMERGDAFGDHPVGTGPFRFARWEKGDRIVLEKNADYWRADRVPVLDEMVFEVIEDPRQRLVALESGALDLAISVLPEELQFVALHPGLVLHETAANNVSYLGINMDRGPLGDLAVRRAIAHAINKGPIVQLAFQGIAIPADGPLPPSQWGYHKPRASYPYDPAASRRLLAEAQTRLRPDGTPVWDPATELTFYAPATPRPYLPSPERVARAIAANLAEVGIQVKLELVPFDVLLATTRNLAHDLCLLGWVGDNGDPDNFLQQLDRDNTTVGSAINVANYRNSLVHNLLRDAQETDDRLERERLYARVQEIVAEEVPWVPLAHARVALAARDDVSGLVLNPTGQVIYRSVRRNTE